MTFAKGIKRINLILAAALLFPLLGHSYSSQPAVSAPAQAAAPVFSLYSSAPDEPDSHLQAIVEDVVGDLPGNWGIAVKKLDTGQYAAYNGDAQQVSASLYKLWVLCELFRQIKAGLVNPNDESVVTEQDAYYDALIGEAHVYAGDYVNLWRAANLMITLSDNTSAAMLVRILGPDNINRFMQQNGLNDSLLDWSGYGDNLTTPLDVLHELEMLATSKMVDEGASKQMLSIMLDQQINNRLPTGLPDGTPFAHKTGDLGGLMHDAGIVYGPTGPFVIVCMSSNLGSYSQAYDAMSELARRVYDYFNARPSSPTLYFSETQQSVGHDFLKFWNTYGGLQAFGYPIAPEQVKGDMLVQQFERARFEMPLQGGGAGAYWQVGLGLVGAERANQLGLSWVPNPDTGNGKYFQQTGQAITGAFYDYWQNNGGEKLFGFPLSPALVMVSPSDGKSYLTQWFERARMEIHPDLPAGHRVVLGTLGSELTTPR